jgi:putative molybdenum carrier protein
MAARWKIVSGGQAGVDRAALDAARALGLPYGGYVPRGRRAEDGPLGDEYENMVETTGAGYPARTRRNVAQSDATLILVRGAPDRGTLLTLETAQAKSKPVLVVDLAAGPPDSALAEIAGWLGGLTPGTLNVAGPRESRRPGLQAEARDLLERLFSRL